MTSGGYADTRPGHTISRPANHHPGALELPRRTALARDATQTDRSSRRSAPAASGQAVLLCGRLLRSRTRASTLLASDHPFAGLIGTGPGPLSTRGCTPVRADFRHPLANIACARLGVGAPQPAAWESPAGGVKTQPPPAFGVRRNCVNQPANFCDLKMIAPDRHQAPAVSTSPTSKTAPAAWQHDEQAGQRRGHISLESCWKPLTTAHVGGVPARSRGQVGLAGHHVFPAFRHPPGFSLRPPFLAAKLWGRRDLRRARAWAAVIGAGAPPFCVATDCCAAWPPWGRWRPARCVRPRRASGIRPATIFSTRASGDASPWWLFRWPKQPQSLRLLFVAGARLEFACV